MTERMYPRRGAAACNANAITANGTAQPRDDHRRYVEHQNRKSGAYFGPWRAPRGYRCQARSMLADLAAAGFSRGEVHRLVCARMRQVNPRRRELVSKKWECDETQGGALRELVEEGPLTRWGDRFREPARRDRHYFTCGYTQPREHRSHDGEHEAGTRQPRWGGLVVDDAVENLLDPETGTGHVISGVGEEPRQYWCIPTVPLIGRWLEGSGWNTETLSDALRRGRPTPERVASRGRLVKDVATYITERTDKLTVPELAKSLGCSTSCAKHLRRDARLLAESA